MNRSTEKLLNDLQGLMEGLEALVAETASRAGERMEGTADSMREKLKEARERLSDVEHDMRGTMRKAAKVAGESISASPWVSLAIVAGIAFLCGAALSRRGWPLGETGAADFPRDDDVERSG